MNSKIRIHQIFYNEATKAMVMPGFIPLDNCKNERPDWFEFLPILNFLRNNELIDGVWYGFLSPKFLEKTGFNSKFVIELLTKYGHIGNVALFSPGWDQLSYFLNPIEQGEFWHPGIHQNTQDFFDSQNKKIDLVNLVTDTSCSVFSNYIVAKKEYWLEWKGLAEIFWEYVESAKKPSYLKNQSTSYGSIENQYPMKTFIQERFASLILANGAYKVIFPDQSLTAPIFNRLFPNDANTRRQLIACDVLKKKYRKTQNNELLRAYWDVRNEISFYGKG